MPGSLLGNAVPRVEDPELLTGHGTYIDNLPFSGLHLAFVRSPYAHARITSIDTSAAVERPGVVAVFTAADLRLPAHHGLMVLNPACARPPLAEDKVRFTGEAVAVVAASSKAAAIDATEDVIVEYEPLRPVVAAEDALADGAPLQFEELGSNLAAGFRDPAAGDPLAGADHVVRGRFENPRIAVLPLEGNAILVDPTLPQLTVWVSTQMPHGFRRMACEVLGLAEDDLRVIAPHVGGAFGSKAGMQAEHTVAIAAARRLGQPVKWVEFRSENMTAMPHGRGQVAWLEMGFRTDGTIVGSHWRVLGDAGAYAGFGGALAMGPTRMMAQGVYRTPAIRYDVAVALTNTTPMGAFRGAGRPEAAAYLERMLDLAADELDIDPVEIRRRNLLAPSEFPYRTLMGPTYDVGAYQQALDTVVRLADYDGLRAEQAVRRERGDRWQLGIGVAVYVEVTAGGSGAEYASVAMDEEGFATIKVGTSGHGQGHPTSFSMIVADALGITLERIRFIQSDTALVPRGGGTGGSRSLQLGGSAIHHASLSVLEAGRRLAAEHLEADPADIVVTGDGHLAVAGVPSSAISWAQVAALAGPSGLEAAFDFAQDSATFPFGAHISVIEVDMETGQVRPIRHIAVDDCGRILNPLIVTGQQHGGIAQGIAQALWEQMVFDDDGNPLTSTLAEYGMPSAAELPSYETSNTETPTPLNPLGAKGIGESGTIGSTPAVQNAVVDALSHLGVRHVDIPCTAEKVWRAIRDPASAVAWSEPPAFFERLPARSAPPPAADEPDL
jgi:carbon-monoxide dehydrogenase large subunit